VCRHGANEHITSATTPPHLKRIIVAQRFRALNLVFTSSRQKTGGQALQRCVVTPNVVQCRAVNYLNFKEKKMATKIYRGTSSSQLAKLENGKLYEGTSSTQIAIIDAPANINEIAAILHVVLGVF
jgi:hypothetical protein